MDEDIPQAFRLLIESGHMSREEARRLAGVTPPGGLVGLRQHSVQAVQSTQQTMGQLAARVAELEAIVRRLEAAQASTPVPDRKPTPQEVEDFLEGRLDPHLAFALGLVPVADHQRDGFVMRDGFQASEDMTEAQWAAHARAAVVLPNNNPRIFGDLA